MFSARWLAQVAAHVPWRKPAAAVMPERQQMASDALPSRMVAAAHSVSQTQTASTKVEVYTPLAPVTNHPTSPSHVPSDWRVPLLSLSNTEPRALTSSRPLVGGLLPFLPLAHCFLIELSELAPHLHAEDGWSVDRLSRLSVSYNTLAHYVLQTSRPHEQLGREGGVCPFLARAIRQQDVFIAAADWRSESDAHTESGDSAVPEADLSASALTALVSSCLDTLLRVYCSCVEWPLTREDLHVTMIVFLPRVSDAQACELWPSLHAAYKPRFTERGLMLGEFYPSHPSPGIHSEHFRPLQSPFPMFVVRRMLAQDFLFLRDGASHGASAVAAAVGATPNAATPSPTASDLSTRSGELGLLDANATPNSALRGNLHSPDGDDASDVSQSSCSSVTPPTSASVSPAFLPHYLQHALAPLLPSPALERARAERVIQPMAQHPHMDTSADMPLHQTPRSGSAPLPHLPTATTELSETPVCALHSPAPAVPSKSICTSSSSCVGPLVPLSPLAPDSPEVTRLAAELAGVWTSGSSSEVLKELQRVKRERRRHRNLSAV